MSSAIIRARSGYRACINSRCVVSHACGPCLYRPLNAILPFNLHTPYTMHVQQNPDHKTTLETLGWSTYVTPDQLRLLQACPYLFAVGRSLRCDRSLAIGPGWLGFLTKACLEVETLIRELPDEEEREMIYATQVKEKYGGLRWYMSAHSDAIDTIVDAAESESFRTCEKCGNRGEMAHTTSGWMVTLCRDLNCRPSDRFPPPPLGRIEDEAEKVDG